MASSTNSLPERLPRPQVAQVWLDFDGTITQQDVLDELILRFSVNDSWKLIEERWQAGLIGSWECLREEFSLLRVTEPELLQFLDRIAVDPGIGPLLTLLHDFEVPVAIVSDGIDRFIRRILRRAGTLPILVRANQITHRNLKLTLQCPLANETCESQAAHCKCDSIKQLGNADRLNIYVGDGRSDLCPARKAHFVFAKGVLASRLEAEQIAFVRFECLRDVCDLFSRSWGKKVEPRSRRAALIRM